MGLRQRFIGAAIHAYLGGTTRQLRRSAHRLTRGARRRLHFFHQVDDPYSHLLVQLVAGLLAQAPLALGMTVVPPPVAALDAEPELRARFGLRDARELAERHGLSLPALERPPAAPLVARANAVLLAERGGAEALAVARAVGDALWAGDAARLEALAARHGAVTEMRATALLGANAAALRRAGHYQGAMLRYEGEWYWGPDRLHYLEERLRGEGLEPTPCLAKPRAADVERATGPLEMYFSFRSPYSYLALDRTLALTRRRGVELRIKPVLPMVMRGFSVPLAKRLHIVRDAAREARRLGVPFGRICDPLGAGVERCLAVFMHAAERGKTADFTLSAARGIWAEALDAADDRDLRRMVERAGLGWHESARSLGEGAWRDAAERHRVELRALGLWGVPSFHLGGYATWGQDRLDRIAERLG